MSDLETLGEKPRTSEDRLGDFYRLAFETRRRLGLKPGYYVLRCDDESFSRIDLSVQAYDDTYVEVTENPTTFGVGLQDQPYVLHRTHSLGIRGQSWSYSARDILVYDSSYSGTDDSELTSGTEDIDASEPLSQEVEHMLHEMLRVLPTLRYDQIDFEHDLIYEWNEDDEDRYDRAKILELRSLEEALSSAGGALYLLQLAALKRHRRRRGPGRHDAEFVIPKTNSIYGIRATFDPEPGETVWHPHVIETSRNEWGGHYGEGDKFTHVITRNLISLGDRISFQTHHALERDNYSLEINADDRIYGLDEKLSDQDLKLVKHLLQEIMGIKR